MTTFSQQDLKNLIESLEMTTEAQAGLRNHYAANGKNRMARELSAKITKWDALRRKLNEAIINYDYPAQTPNP